MQTTYAQKNGAVQKASVNTAESVVDSSSQSATLQRHASLADGVAQRAPESRPNLTGMPDNLKNGIESLSGFSMDDVRVHYNSSKPAAVQALAYTQGTDIHVAPGQEKCLPHEAWHVAQQMAGRVSPTTNINGMPVNDNAALEHEADVMGEKAVQCKSGMKETIKSNVQKCNVGQFLVDDVKKYFGIGQNNTAVNMKINGIKVNVLRKDDSCYQITRRGSDTRYLIWRTLTNEYHKRRPKSNDLNEDKINSQKVKIDLVYDGCRTELWYGFSGPDCTEYDGYIVAHGNNSGQGWNALSVMNAVYNTEEEKREWDERTDKINGIFNSGHDETCYNWNDDAIYGGDAVSKVIAERGRFDCLRKINSDKQSVRIGNIYLTPKEVWGSLASMLDYRDVANFLNNYFDKYKKDGLTVASQYYQEYFNEREKNDTIKNKVKEIIESNKVYNWKNLFVSKVLPIKNKEFVQAAELFGDIFIHREKQKNES